MPRLLLLAFIWGWSFLFIKVGVEGMTPTAVAGARIALGAVVLVAVVRFRGMTLPRDRAFWREAALTGLTANVFPFCLLAWGEERITSALTSVLNAATPLFTALAVAVLLGERLRWSQLVGLGVGLAGAAYAAGLGGDDFGDSSLTGSGAAVLAGVCYAIAFVQIRNLIERHPPEVAAAGQLVAAAVVLAPVAVATSVAHGIDAEPHRLLAIALLGLVGTGVAYVLNYRIVAELGPTKASLVTYVIPVVAVAVGVAFLDERFHIRLLLGGALIVVGISLVNQRLRLPARPAAVPAP